MSIRYVIAVDITGIDSVRIKCVVQDSMSEVLVVDMSQ